MYDRVPINITDPSKSFQICINITIIDDEDLEGPESMSVHLSLTSGASTVRRVATVIINDDRGKKHNLIIARR